MLWIGLACAADWSGRVDVARQGAVLDVIAGVHEVEGHLIQSRHVLHPDHDLARDFLLGELRSIEGLSVETEDFEAAERQSTNLIATLPGRDASLAPLIVSAHFDSTAVNSEGFDPQRTVAPGADDDGSGVVAVLELARLLSSEPGYERTIEFILFDAEEIGLLGSAYHVRHLSGEVFGMMSIDSIGQNPTGLLFVSVGEGAEHLQAAFESAVQQQTLSHVERMMPVEAALLGSPRSDHGPFIAAGYPAAHVAAFPLPPTYHTSEDARDVVDPVYLADTTAIVAGVLSDLAVPSKESTAEMEQGCGCVLAGPRAVPLRWLGRRR